MHSNCAYFNSNDTTYNIVRSWYLIVSILLIGAIVVTRNNVIWLMTEESSLCCSSVGSSCYDSQYQHVAVLAVVTKYTRDTERNLSETQCVWHNSGGGGHVAVVSPEHDHLVVECPPPVCPYLSSHVPVLVDTVIISLLSLLDIDQTPWTFYFSEEEVS